TAAMKASQALCIANLGNCFGFTAIWASKPPSNPEIPIK
ncbi:MAG: hypothetical protein RLZZ147_782, partial [Actinomycetota bacterium]